MQTHPALRPRVSGGGPVAGIGGLRQIMRGLFGYGAPDASASAEVVRPQSLYHYHEGDLFTPGTGNFVIDPAFDVPLTPIWGGGFFYPPNQFSVRQPPPVTYNRYARVNGIGGIIPGQWLTTPLSANPGE